MHNRGRLITASFLAKTLYVDWRVGARALPRPARRRRRGQQPAQLAVGGRHRRQYPPRPGAQPADPGQAVRPARRLRTPLGARAGARSTGPRCTAPGSCRTTNGGGSTIPTPSWTSPRGSRDSGGHVANEGALCLVTGATGYIGGRLVPELLAQGHRVRCAARSPERLRDHPWSGDVDMVRADLTDPEDARHALEGVDVAYYLIHSLGTGHDFAETDRRTAETFAAAAKRGRGAPHRLPRRTRAGRSRDLSRAPALARRGRRHPAGLGRADRGAAGRRRHRVRARRRSRCCAISPSGCRSWSRRGGCTPASSRSPSETCCATSSAAPRLPADVNRPSTSAARTS